MTNSDGTWSYKVQKFYYILRQNTLPASENTEWEY